MSEKRIQPVTPTDAMSFQKGDLSPEPASAYQTLAEAHRGMVDLAPDERWAQTPDGTPYVAKISPAVHNLGQDATATLFGS